MPAATNYLPSQPAPNQFWMRGQTATASEPKLPTGLVIAVVSIGAVLLLGLIGGTIFVSLSGNETESAEGESMEDQEVASANSKATSEGEPRADQPSDTPVSSPGDEDFYTSSGDQDSENDDSFYDEGDNAPTEYGDGAYPNYSDQSPTNNQSPVFQQDSIAVSSPTNTERHQSDVSIRLYRGVALPQTLPMGTGIGFSANYEFSSGNPRSSSRYFWVIFNRQGQSMPISVRLSNEGSMPPAFIGWQKYQAPFTCHIEEVTPQGNRRKISDKLTFQ
jgi:hypothetical protein